MMFGKIADDLSSGSEVDCAVFIADCERTFETSRTMTSIVDQHFSIFNSDEN